MTAPLFFAAPALLAGAAPGTRLLLDGPEGHHAADVMRLAPGEGLSVADGCGLVAQGTVAAVGRGSVEVVVDRVERVAQVQPRFVLVQALAKGDRDLLAIEMATELGVDEVVPWAAARSVVVWRGERAGKAHAKWERTVTTAAKQARRPVVPAVTAAVDRAALVQRAAAAALALVLHEEAAEPLTDATLPPTGDVLLVVGPEGGIAPDELAALQAAGARTVRLGSTVLRTSTAGAAALSVLSAQERWR